MTPRSSSQGRRPGGECLRAVEVSRSFEGVQALEGVSLRVDRSEVVGLIGPNGAGKTTLVNLITGFDVPDSGRIELDGREITAWSAVRRASSGLARTFQHGHLFAGLSAIENVEVAALGVGARSSHAHMRARELLEMLGLGDRADHDASMLPHGDESKLGVARALATDPRYLLMDEPAAGLSEPELPALVNVIRSVRDQHRAGVLLIDHNVTVIMEACDRVVVLDGGRVLSEGTPEEIRANPRVAAAYLGTVRA
ncbi:MAG: ATP-binding cassette domain-containing protein [Solirubrobacterales bacterium]|nr:ATP-binding cassette domain-containing protein [Solirubrobacterales bacterium]